MRWTGYRRVERQHHSPPALSFLAMALFGGVGAAEVQLPPNTDMLRVVDVAGTTNANDAFWKEKCTVIPEQATTLFIVVIMGEVIDFFRPVKGATFCEMLQSNAKHQWSYNGVEWITPAYHDTWTFDQGSSAVNWPRDNVERDERYRLSSWGQDYTLTGGCCSSSTAVDRTYPSLPGNGDSTIWGQNFSMSYAIQLQPLPPNTGVSLVANVAGTTKADDVYWAEQCKTIPLDALFIVVAMGTVRDLFKPVEGATFCEMMQSNSKHQWSYNGVDWVTPPPHANANNNGGSVGNWPRDKGRAEDKRKCLTFWGIKHGNLTGGCCSTSAEMYSTYTSQGGWGQSFVVSYAIQLQPLPPNTAMGLVVNVAGTTFANDAFWAEHCKTIPSTTLFIVVDMGAVRELFRPAEGVSFCEMLQSNDKHQWSYNGVAWVTPAFHAGNTLGGSDPDWPRDNGRTEDKRSYLSFWGANHESPRLTGGCCSTSTAVDAILPSLPGNGLYTNWGHSFVVSYAIQLQPLPPNTGMSLVADVAGTTFANDVYWAEQCKTIPPNTLFIVIDMGAVRDFFKPTKGSTYCEMLQMQNKHQWSPDGVEWRWVDFYEFHNGGSAAFWPRDNVDGDERKYLSNWGDDGLFGTDRTGGCCSSSTAVGKTRPSLPVNGNRNTWWGQTFSMSYAIQLQVLPPHTTMSLVANVAGTTRADNTFWAEKCKSIPLDALFIVVDMGAVRDFFRPGKGVSFCDMMQSDRKHQWSYNGVDWVTPAFHDDGSHNGGSENWLPSSINPGDKRSHVSFWGRDNGLRTGGCCSSSTAVDRTNPTEQPWGWGQTFSTSYAINSTAVTTTTSTTTATTGTATSSLLNQSCVGVELKSGALITETNGGIAGEAEYTSPNGWLLRSSVPTYKNGNLYWLSNLIDGSTSCNPESCSRRFDQSECAYPMCFYVPAHSRDGNNQRAPTDPFNLTLTLPKQHYVRYIELDPLYRSDSTLGNIKVLVDGVDVTPAGFQAALSEHQAATRWSTNYITEDCPPLLRVNVNNFATTFVVSIEGASNNAGFGEIKLFGQATTTSMTTTTTTTINGPGKTGASNQEATVKPTTGSTIVVPTGATLPPPGTSNATNASSVSTDNDTNGNKRSLFTIIGVVAAVAVLLLVGVGVWFVCFRKQVATDVVGAAAAAANSAAVLRHLPQHVTTNPAYTVEAARTRSGAIIVATDSNQKQFSIPMEGESVDYLEPVTRNKDYTYAPPMPLPTPRPRAAANAAVVKDAGGYVVDDYIAKDAGGYVVDDYVPDGGGGGGGSGNAPVYATYNAGAGGAGAAAEYSVPTEGDTTDGVYARAAGGDSNA